MSTSGAKSPSCPKSALLFPRGLAADGDGRARGADPTRLDHADLGPELPVLWLHVVEHVRRLLQLLQRARRGRGSASAQSAVRSARARASGWVRGWGAAGGKGRQTVGGSPPQGRLRFFQRKIGDCLKTKF